MIEIIKKFKKGIFLTLGLVSILLVTGCGVEYQKDSEGKVITDDNGARVVTNQMDQDTTFGEVWEEGGWYDALLVFPLVKLITFIGELTSSYGLAIILSTFITRLITLPLTLKGTKSQRKMKLLQPKVDKIKLKYAGKKDRESQMRMNAEMQKLYKEEGINPLGGCIGLIITMPLFFAFYSAVYRTPGIFEEPFLGLDLDVIPKIQTFNLGLFVYLVPVILVFAVNLLSMKFTQMANKPEKADVKRAYNAESQKNPNVMEQQMKMMTYFMPALMAFISFSTVPVGVSYYFISSSLFAIFQTFIVKKVS